VHVVLRDELVPFPRHFVIRENRIYRAFGHAGTAIDTLIGMYIILIRTLVDAIDRANIDASRVLNVNARLGNDIGHVFLRLLYFETPRGNQLYRAPGENCIPPEDMKLRNGEQA
jgi:hypothetical protein